MLSVCISKLVTFSLFKLVSAKTANSKLESELKQEKGNAQDIRKMLADERNVMSTMDMEHQQQLVELEQRHQEKVPIVIITLPVLIFLQPCRFDFFFFFSGALPP